MGNAGCPLHPQPRVQLVLGRTHTSIHNEYTGTPDVPARNGFNGLLRALPGDRALLPPSPHGLKVLSDPVEPNEPPQDLTPASRRQDHTTSPSASSAVVLRAAHRSRRAIRPALRIRTPDAAASTASHPASVTIAIRPLCGTRRRIYRSDLGRRGTDKFFAMGIDSPDHTKSSPTGGYFFTRPHSPS